MRCTLSIALFLALAGPAAQAADVTATLHVKRGHLTLREPTTHVRIAAPTRAVAASHATTGVTVADRRGTGAGWGLQLAVTLRRPGGRIARGARVTVSGVRVRCRSTCTLPRTRMQYPVVVGAVPMRVFAARPGSGMGTMRVLAEVALELSRKAPAGPHVLVQSWSRVAGP